jgi:hypothetical protein
MQKRLNEFLDEEQYTTRSLANGTIKLTCKTPDTYRKLVRYMRDNNITHHTYQPQEEPSYQAIIKYLHHSVVMQDLTDGISQHGHKVRTIISTKHRVTKDPLNLFFADVEPSDTNKDIYRLNRLQNSVIQIQPPRKSKHLVQCTRCQLYGHTKSHCNRP